MNAPTDSQAEGAAAPGSSGPGGPGDLVLYGGPTSPFARMARVLGEELGLAFRYEVIDVYTAEFLDRFNPLRQIPTLVVNGERAVFDSRTIFDAIARWSGREDVLPGADGAQATRVALMLGTTEACLQYRMEIIRPDGERSQRVIDKLMARMGRCLDHLESDAQHIAEGPLRLEQVVAACTLEYVDFRYSRSWRDRCPRLDAWSRAFARRDSMLASRPAE